MDIMGDIGRSTQTSPMHTRVDASNWLAAVLDVLALSSAHLIGASFGGFLSANLAVLQPHRVRSLVLLAPAATLQPFSLMAKLFIRLGSLVPLPSTVRPGLRAMMCGGLPDERLVRQMEVGVAGFRYDHDGIFPSEIPDEELRTLRCPTLILVGDQERIYAPESAVSRAAKQMPHAVCEVLHGLGHLLGMQDPLAVNSRITGFLAQIDPVLRY
ncbi:MAG: alpha/beta hydrolase [Burkholderiaceae bacterium]|nr:alpha/beta hydrolase [Burkholderiaceae bacterium]